MPTRDRILNIIHIIIASNGACGDNPNNANNARNRAYWRHMITWAEWCAGFQGYTKEEWSAFFCEEGDFTIQEWTAWILDFYDRQDRK